MQLIIDYLESEKSEFGELFRYTKNYVLDTPRTGRTLISQLPKAEKTILGIKFEQVFKQKFDLPEGNRLDCIIEGCEVDIKFTCRNNWMIPPKCFNEVCMVAQISEDFYSLGVIKITPELLTVSENWDRKKQIKVAAQSQIHWIERYALLTHPFVATLNPPLPHYPNLSCTCWLCLGQPIW